ncbi:glutathione peroxidase [Aerococcaceae bacterium NML201209]|nr:glutathione peroxidase [Aerococcaceae bacterium NML201209]
MALPNIALTLSTGEQYPLETYAGQVLLVVNTATQCGFTPQLEGLETLYQTYRGHGFTVLGFPCNQFGSQEPLANEDIATTCQLNYGVTFPLHQKCEVNGTQTHPLFQWLKQEQGGILTDDIKWNFTKFLIDRQGNVIKRYAPTTTPEQIHKEIEETLR